MHFPIHFTLSGHEGRLATISRTRLTHMAADESGSYPPAAELLVIADRVF